MLFDLPPDDLSNILLDLFNTAGSVDDLDSFGTPLGFL